jgi:hypothetical protein
VFVTLSTEHGRNQDVGDPPVGTPSVGAPPVGDPPVGDPPVGDPPVRTPPVDAEGEWTIPVLSPNQLGPFGAPLVSRLDPMSDLSVSHLCPLGDRPLITLDGDSATKL